MASDTNDIVLLERIKKLAPGFYTERDGGRWYVLSPDHERIAEDFDERGDARRLVCALAGDEWPEGWYALSPGSNLCLYLFGPKMTTATLWTQKIEKCFPGVLARLPNGEG